MRALIVYESMFGNTKAVAEAIARGIGGVMPADLVEVGAAPKLGDIQVDLLVVGGPTHAFGLSRESTRRDAAARAGRQVISAGPGVREWLESNGHAHLRVAAFDTHVRKPNLPGRAGRATEKRLRDLGCQIVAKAQSFYVHGYEGPLLDGELDRAQAWGTEVGNAVVHSAV